MSVSIRIARDTDVHELVPLAARTFPLACPPEMDSTAIDTFVRDELNAEIFAEWIASDKVYVLVATDGAMLVGYTVCINDELPTEADIHRDLPDEGAVMMSKFYVHPEFHGAGVSKNMMAHLMDHYSTSDRDWMWLGTNQANARAITFYERTGFQQVGTRTFDVGGTQAKDVVLARKLPSVE
ncbi:GNAT family N-acetyltransferase [Yaniella halotolerans]|uniref:GNAT family N-acetyltransferase n=1 Tax=Yaniella halotolerans TaxID=225453 RepID=UPI0003B4E7FF|nr:GNAT family N-acetyltransferase [Yaniella halotolerans]